MKELIQDFNKSPSIIHFLLKHKPISIAIVVVPSFILRFILEILQKVDTLGALGNALEFASIISATFIAMLLYFRESINNRSVKNISKTKNSVIFGLGEFSTALLKNESLENKHHFIVVERDIKTDEVEHLRDEGIGVIISDVFELDYHKQLNIEMMEIAIISLGNDKLNIELATKIIDTYKSSKVKTPIQLLIQIVNQDLNILFHQEFVAPQIHNEHQIEIQTFSFYEECAKSFFDNNFIDGKSRTIIDSNDDFHIIIAGDGELAHNIIYQSAHIAQLPNENKLHIHLLDKEANKLKLSLIKRYIGIEKVVKLHTHNIDNETLEYFQNDLLWKQEYLTHVIICYDDEEKNIKIAIDLFNKTYLGEAVDGTLFTQVNFAIFNSYTISERINADDKNFKQFYSFGDASKICMKEKLLNENFSLIAKLIHYGYADEFNPSQLLNLNDKDIQKKWFNSSKRSDKLSNKAQARHIDMKLKALGLSKIHTDKKPSELLITNRNILDKVIKDERDILKLSDTFIHEYSKELPKIWNGGLEVKDIKYFPVDFNTKLEKLIRAEHNRWNAYHYLNGWKYAEVKSKPKKEHDCLKPLAQFDTPELKLTVIYDMYAILYMPNYLANAGFEMVDFKEEK